MAISDPSLALNPLLGTPMGPLNGVVPPNPLIAQAMAQPIPPPVASPGQGGAAQMPTQENLDKAMSANKGMSDLLAQLLGAPSIAPKDVLDVLGTAVGKGYLTAQQAASEIAKMPQDPEAVRRWLQGHFVQNMQTGRRITELGAQLAARARGPKVA